MIVAAGISSRMYPRTKTTPKGLLPLGETTLLGRSVKILQEMGIRKIAIVTGYLHQQIRDALGGDLHYIPNPFYRHCNNMGSLWFARSFVGEDPFVYLHGDIVYHRDILHSALDDWAGSPNDMEMVTDFSHFDEESMKVRLDENQLLIESKKEIPLDEAHGEWTGIALVGNPGALFESIEEIMMSGELNHYDTSAFNLMARRGFRLHNIPTGDLPWIEIDFPDDYLRAREMFQ